VNQLAQFLQYTQKVFDLPRALAGVRARRQDPEVSTCAVLLCLLLGVVLRIPSYLDLAQQSKRRRWRHLCHLKRAVADDMFDHVTERLVVEDLRLSLVGAVKRLKANKALESCKINGLLWLSLDANEHFKSRSRCCGRCCQRQVEETDQDGHKHKVTEYYHRYVFAQINGPKLNVVIDVEPIRPGQDECAAALRLLGRVRRLYGPRFFDGVTADAWYAKGPFLRALDKLGWLWAVVLKREDMEVYQEALTLSRGQKPDAAFRDQERRREVKLWQVKDLRFSDGYDKPVCVVLSEERWTETKVQGGKKSARAQQSQWMWVACQALAAVYAPGPIYQAGHRRWGIENKAFNELTQAYHLEHCYHHDPTSMLSQMLILVLGFTLFTAFAQLHSQLIRLGDTTLKALTDLLNLALEHDLPWERWFQPG
jgi:hypothetical protein